MFGRRRDENRLGVKTAVVVIVAGLLAVAVGVLANGPDATSVSGGPSGSGATTGAASGSAAAPTSTVGMQATAVPGPSTSASASAGPTRRPSSPPVVYQPTDHPNPATTGVPAGTTLRTLQLNSGNTYRVTAANTVLDKVHIKGNLLVTALNVTIRNSQIDGFVLDEYGGKDYSFTISDSTVGPASGCLSSPGVGEANFRATRVLVRGHSDGFRASGDNVNIQDSYVRLCSNPGDHSDGIQTYLTGKNLVLNHTTIDQRNVASFNAPIFIADEQAEGVTVTNNLVMGGTYTIQVKNFRGNATVKYNRVVDKTWAYAPVESDCSAIDWDGNSVVTIDANYRITSVVRSLPCAN